MSGLRFRFWSWVYNVSGAHAMNVEAVRQRAVRGMAAAMVWEAVK